MQIVYRFYHEANIEMEEKPECVTFSGKRKKRGNDNKK
jgi:hypothetical protein